MGKRNHTEKATWQASLSYLPQVGQLLQRAEVTAILEHWPRPLVLQTLRDGVDLLREQVINQGLVLSSKEQACDEILRNLEAALRKRRQGDLRRVINATGVIVHTNLGRSPLAERALQRVQEVAAGYSNLEFDLEGRKRGRRMAGVKQLLRELTGAEEALVVNNCAAAVMLVLASAAHGKEVIISRGELIEIGGSFRIPEVMEAAGVKLREVGTTNRTHLRDYEAAIGPDTGMLLKVHCSNYAIKGFTKEVPLTDLVALGQQHALLVMVDLGSGLLLDMHHAGTAIQNYDHTRVYEPTVQEVVQTGVDLVTWSGDKMLGGPQAGIILGHKDWVQKAAKHPIARALRSDKLTVAALEATLQIYAEGQEQVISEIPVWQSMTCSMDVLRQRADTLVSRLQDAPGLTLHIVEGHATVGGGAVPHTFLPSIRVSVQHAELSTEALERALRFQSLPILGLVEDNKVMLDMRTLAQHELEEVEAGLRTLTQE